MSILGSPLALGRTAEIYPWENDCVLKLFRSEFSPQLADQEWQRAELVWSLGAPVPRPVELIEVDGRCGVVFQRIHGPTLAQLLRRYPLRTDHYAQQFGRLHTELHRLSTPGFPSMHERARNAIGQNSLISESRKRLILDLLERLPDVDTLCHGDFHPENILQADTGPMVIDWEGSMHGEPDADVARTVLLLRVVRLYYRGAGSWIKRAVVRRFESVYLSTYQRMHGPVRHLQEWLALHAACWISEETRPFIPFFEKSICTVIPTWLASKSHQMNY